MSDVLEQRLRAVLEHARDGAPWWAARIPRSFNCALDTLRTLPPVTRQEVQRERVRLTSTTGDSSSWRMVRSSGTTGEPVAMILDAAAIEAEGIVVAKHLDQLLSASWRSRPVIHVALHPEATSGAWRAPWGGVAAKWNLSRVWHASEAIRSRSIRFLDGTIVNGLPSVIDVIATADVPAPRPLAIVLSGENVGGAAARIAERFSTLVTSHYVLSETGIAGVACGTEGGYHAATENAFIEIADGEILITPLVNRAMVLLRYRTNDAGAWLSGDCGCGNPRPRFSVLSRRSNENSRAATVSLRLAKFFGQLGVTRFNVQEQAEGVLRVAYRPLQELGEAQRRQVASVVAHVAPAGAEIVLHEEGATEPLTRMIARSPADLEILQRRFGDRDDVLCAVVGGSAADPDARRRDSDVDCIVLLRDRRTVNEWIAIARELARDVPRLSVHVAVAEELAARAPLVAARLLDAHIHVTGAPLSAILRRPTDGELRSAARYFCHEAQERLWERLTAPFSRPGDPIAESAWISRIAIDALRYRQLLRGGRETRVDALLNVLRADTTFPSELLDDLTVMVDVAREHRPPPIPEEGLLRDWLVAAWMCVEIAARESAT